jgi:hypothetical protein
VQTLANGEIIALDSGGYGAVTIDKSVAIIAPDGVYAGVSVFGSVPPAPPVPGANIGVLINGTNLRVVLRNLQVNGQGDTNGIVVSGSSTGTELHVERVTFSNLALHGIQLQSPTKLHVLDSIFRDNANSAIISIAAAAGSEIAIDNARFERNGNSGVETQGNATIGINRSMFSANTNAGVLANAAGITATIAIQDSSFFTNGIGASFGGTSVQASMRNSMVARNTTAGLNATNGATLLIDSNTVTGNTVGVIQSGTGAVWTVQSNSIKRNPTDVSGALTPLSPN